jgi:hypothetical protein
MKTLIVALVVCVCAAFQAVAQNGTATNLSGTWQIEYHDKNGKEVDTPVVTLLQSGGKLEGVFGNKHWKVDGTVVGDDVKFWFSPPTRPDITVRYHGKLENSNQLRGTMASEVQSGTFVALRK